MGDKVYFICLLITFIYTVRLGLLLHLPIYLHQICNEFHTFINVIYISKMKIFSKI